MRPPVIVLMPVSIKWTFQRSVEVVAHALDRPRREVDREVVVVRPERAEVFFDDLLFVAERDDELVEAGRRVDVEQVPQDRLAADFHHRLGTVLGLLGDARAEAAREDHGLHVDPPLAAGRRESGPVRGAARPADEPVAHRGVRFGVGRQRRDDRRVAVRVERAQRRVQRARRGRRIVGERQQRDALAGVCAPARFVVARVRIDEHDLRARRVVRRQRARRAHRAADARDDGRAERVAELRRRDRAGAQHRGHGAGQVDDRRLDADARRAAVDDQVHLVAEIGAHVLRAGRRDARRSGSRTAPRARRRTPRGSRARAGAPARAPRRCPARPSPRAACADRARRSP